MFRSILFSLLSGESTFRHNTTFSNWFLPIYADLRRFTLLLLPMMRALLDDEVTTCLSHLSLSLCETTIINVL